jgi:hypothetical protein
MMYKEEDPKYHDGMSFPTSSVPVQWFSCLVKRKAQATKQFLNALDRCPEVEWKRKCEKTQVIAGNKTKNAMLNCVRSLD